MKNKVVNVIDSTLREGNQSPGSTFDVAKSVKIAELLNLAAVDMIEIGHPFASELEMKRVQQVVALKGHPVLSHARANRKDVQAVAQTGAAWIGIFAGVNEISQKFRLRKGKDQILQMIAESVAFAKDLGLKVRFTVEDSSRTTTSDLVQAYDIAVQAGADRICFADTLGILDYTRTHSIVTMLKLMYLKTELEVHFHDDRGLALSNALAAVSAGANWISCSVNGIGERAGIVDTSVLITNLVFEGLKPARALEGLLELSSMVKELTNTTVDERRPVIGKNAFIHTAKLHQDAMNLNPTSYNWIEPTSFIKSINQKFVERFK